LRQEEDAPALLDHKLPMRTIGRFAEPDGALHGDIWPERAQFNRRQRGPRRAEGEQDRQLERIFHRQKQTEGLQVENIKLLSPARAPLIFLLSRTMTVFLSGQSA
jgi:hypothetical protein